MAKDLEDQPLRYGAQTAPPVPIGPPPLPPTSQLDLVLRRPPPHSFGPSSHSSDSRSSALTSPQSLASSNTSYSIGGLEKVINIGIDFGTTYSGVSWAISNNGSKDINVVQDWPGKSKVKVPTEICYKDGGISWGYSIPPEAERLKWFKLLLLGNDVLPAKIHDSKQLRAARQLLEKLKKSPVEVVADYLRQLWSCAMNDIRRHLPNSVDSMPFRVILTTPANWPNAAREEMRKAAQQAGILDRRMGGLDTKLEFIGEPEAAALAAFHDGAARGNISVGDISVGDIVVICDAGGGTVDIVTYEVERTFPTVNLGECVGGDMELCGSIFLDERFQAYMEEMMGKDKLAKLPKSVLQKLMDTWETNIKCQYERGSPELPVDLPHQVAKAVKSPGNIFKRRKGREKLSGDAMRFTPEEIEGIFDPVMKDILTLINKQISATMRKKQRKPKAIALVGGLGSNKFLHQKLKAEFSAGDISIIQPRDLMTWSSICRGAAIKGLTFDDEDDQVLPVVTSYISKAHYGIAFKVPFEDGKHSEADRRVDKKTNMSYAFNQMEWYMAKGDDVSKENPKTLTWERHFPETRPCPSFNVELYECEDEDPPTRITTNVKQCGTITIPVSWNELPLLEPTPGQRYRRVQFDLRTSMLGMGKLDFTTYVEGNLVSRKNVNVKLGDRVSGP